MGAFSYSLYLIHGLVVYVGIVLFDRFHISGRNELILCLTLLPTVSIATGYSFYLLVEKRFQSRGFAQIQGQQPRIAVGQIAVDPVLSLGWAGGVQNPSGCESDSPFRFQERC